MSDNTYCSSPPEELAVSFMDPSRPKTELEHWAVREIEKQRAEIERLHQAHQAACEGGERLRAEIDGLEAELALMKSGFEIAYRAMGDKP